MTRNALIGGAVPTRVAVVAVTGMWSLPSKCSQCELYVTRLMDAFGLVCAEGDAKNQGRPLACPLLEVNAE